MKLSTKEENKQVVTLHGLLGAEAIQEEILARCKQAALATGIALLEEEVLALCGPSFSRKGDGERCYRGGSDNSTIVVSGAKYSIKRPRVRKDDKEVQLSMLEKLQSQDILDGKIYNAMINGVSTRNYDKVIDGFEEKLGVSKSSVSRAFTRESQKYLSEINESSLKGYKFVAITIDGFYVCGRALIVAMGVTEELKKVPLGIKEGDTENSVIVKDLLSSIQERGFETKTPYFLAILDGSKALRRAVLDVFGSRALIQRCWLHKLRNLKKYVPDKLHGTLHWRMKKLMNLENFEDALKELQSFARWISEISQGALESLEEAGEELLTLHKLGIGGQLRKKLTTSNMIESIISVARSKMKRVRSWTLNSTKALRWAASAICNHKTRFRSIATKDKASFLIAALSNPELAKLTA